MRVIGALIVALMAAVSAHSARAAACHNQTDKVTVTGTVFMRAEPPEHVLDPAKHPTYSIIALNDAVCVRGAKPDKLTYGKIAFLGFMGPSPDLKAGQRITLQGQFHVRDNDTQPPEQLMFMVDTAPPDAPGKDEVAISGENDEVAAHCAEFLAKTNRNLGSETLKVVITKTARWGTIYRADVSHPIGSGYPPMLWRNVCMKGFFLDRPLEMFDPSKSVPRL